MKIHPKDYRMLPEQADWKMLSEMEPSTNQCD
jgi:hypothetical protein